MPKRAYSVGAGASRATASAAAQARRRVGSALEDLRACPSEVQDAVGYALFLAQRGIRHPATKGLKGALSGLVEIVADFEGNTYRAVYTAKLARVVYVLHVFQKKSTHGIATPRHELKLIARRLLRAREHHVAHYPAKNKER